MFVPRQNKAINLLRIINEIHIMNIYNILFTFTHMDSYRHKGLRKKLIQTLTEKGINNPRVIEAMNLVPRHLFLDKAFEEWAYKDQAFPIGSGQTISQPYTVAFQTQLLDPQPHEKILEIGTGSGYQAAVLSHLCKKIYSIERHKDLYINTSGLLNRIGYKSVRTLLGDGYKGAPRFAPFDKVIITAGASSIPDTLLEQLKVGGHLIIPVGISEDKTMKKITKIDIDQYEEQSFGIFHFVPFLQGVT
jgi:protein-L-isoaspartate(D-aspartate) O-methyltransferase